ncbi:ABC transporter ATP-binding protein [Flavobacterium noncentrifugens]|uniref:Putative ABC transport system ATP-binding protein n=2 Tax=Flavobacterium noncentrifugens TaxID=1128970 RepID=A0A1G8WYA9_9FLAO|nr:ABC transporter ATP-binding protein [Flavobacterium noncentrifugens]SDJ83037.1 putative ABC transport system ATP-binding protein [Flavobacterium noncentrifugens]
MSVIVEIKNLKRDFTVGNEIVKALDDVSFTINSGEFITIMGSSGSGKTTLLNILGCLEKPTQGTYLLDGNNVSNLSKNELAALRNSKLGFVFQSYNLLSRTSAIENVELPLLYNNKFTPSQRREKSIKALEAVKLSDRLDHLPSQLSGGQQQRVAIARALVNDPVMILADEATGNLDSRTSYEIMMLIQELNSQGKTIVFVTHEPDIATFSKRTITLKDGKILKDVINKNVSSAKEVLAKLLPLNEEPAQ